MPSSVTMASRVPSSPVPPPLGLTSTRGCCRGGLAARPGAAAWTRWRPGFLAAPGRPRAAAPVLCSVVPAHPALPPLLRRAAPGWPSVGAPGRRLASLAWGPHLPGLLLGGSLLRVVSFLPSGFAVRSLLDLARAKLHASKRCQIFDERGGALLPLLPFLCFPWGDENELIFLEEMEIL
ncbi:hypothetical protein U9M48_007462 [Paspalum notatum var. saurae]|uniref:Uncharacterized protein n=1 Tax=Paspalum notatum var. saurae TaxID=547442 RepID=A0AAQ3SKC7_PASNO